MHRADDLIDTTEMYLRCVLELEEDGVIPMRARIAGRLGQSFPTVSQTVARMQRDGLVTVAGDRRIELTPEGRSAATRVMRKHRLAECLLADILGLDWQLVHDEACRWEHVMSDAVERRVLDILGHPALSPYGNPIPGVGELGDDEASGFPQDTIALSAIPETAANVVVRRIGEPVQSDTELLARLRRAGIGPDTAILVSRAGGRIQIGAGQPGIEIGHTAEAGGAMLDVEQRSGAAVVRLRHGKVNALDLELLQAITAAMGDVEESAAVVITGTGTAFSAGVDLQRILAGGPSYVQEFLPALSAAFMAIFDHPGPVLAAINGHAIAGGCVIAAACDVRVMSQGKIGLAELSVGVPFPPSAMEILRHVIGPAASGLVLTAALLGAPQAQSIGLIDGIEAPDTLLDSVLRHAQTMAQIPADVFAFSKRQLQRPARERIAARSGDEEAVLAMWSSARTRDAIAGYLNTLKQRPR